MNGDLMMGGDAGLQGQSMAPFLTKLFQIVSNLATDQAIIWTPKGDSFVIIQPYSLSASPATAVRAATATAAVSAAP